MNNAKMWLVVKPTVGVPLFLTAVAVGSLAVHVAVLSKVSWYNDYVAGQPLGTGDKMAAAERLGARENTANASYVLPGGDASREVTLILPDGTSVRAVLDPPEIHASAKPLTAN